MGAIPRQDIYVMLDKNILSELTLVEGKNSWQNRKAAIGAYLYLGNAIGINVCITL